MNPQALAIAAITMLASTSASLAAPPFADKTPDGENLEVRPEHGSLGTVYYSLSRRDKQVYFESNAPLEDIKGQSDRVLGYVIAESDENLVAGEWHLPVRSLRTGIELRDDHLYEKQWLWANEHPDVIFQLERVADLTTERSGTGFRTYRGTLVGDLTLRGVTLPRIIENATLTFLDESERTRAVAPGDLLQIRASFDVPLGEHEVSNVAIDNGKVAQVVELDIVLYMSTQRP
ncbi:MAG: YceI family protein [Planctomycetota bacterium]